MSMRVVVLSLAALVILQQAHATHVKGSIELDAWTFNKVVGGERDVLVKFDKDYAYGDKEDAFKEVCKRIGEADASMFVGVVAVQEYGDKLNEDLAARFGVKKDNFPVYKLFKKGSTTPVDYKGEVTANALTLFLKSEAGLYLSLPGCLQEFDRLAQSFMTSSDRAAVKAQAETAAAGLTASAEQESGKYYVLLMKKILEKGDGFVTLEMARVNKLIAGSAITEAKKGFFNRRLNILPSFKASDKKEL